MTTELHDQLDAVLSAAISLITDGAHDQPRPFQAKLSHKILSAMIASRSTLPVVADTQVASISPTGSGKSVAYLSAAMLMAATGNGRSIISTESLMLQDQIMTKDAPVVAEAVGEVTGYTPTVALLKGWSNYVCHRDVASNSSAVFETDHEVSSLAMDTLAAWMGDHPTLPVASSLSALVKLAKSGDTSSWRPRSSAAKASVTIDKRTFSARSAVSLLAWAGTGDDKRHYTGNTDDDVWSLVSTSSGDCSGAKKCEFADQCVPLLAREATAAADIIVTNHAYLAVQAATGAPILLGNSKIGVIDHLVLDEAHGITSIVRAAAAAKLGRRPWSAMVSRVERIVDDPALTADGKALADVIENAISAHLSGSHDVTLGPDDHPIGPGLIDQMTRWMTAAARAVPKHSDTWPAKTQRAYFRAKSALGSMNKVIADSEQSEENLARWIDARRCELNIAPVMVADKMVGSLYQVTEEGEGEEPDVRHLSVASVSATLPASFCWDTGLRVPITRYDSPFIAEFGASVLYIPAPDPTQFPALGGPAGGGKFRMDTNLHHQWAIAHVIELVRANHGSALILTASKSHGQDFVTHLESAGLGFPIFSQWGDLSTPDAVEAWKSHDHSVIVGTRSLMTGVDAPGNTNTLVIIDRVPRSAPNALDDARAAVLMRDGGVNKWTAAEKIYASDACLLLEQAAGRLIRRHGDTGVVAILDPRLLKRMPFAYNPSTVDRYLLSVKGFAQRTTSLEEVTTWMSTSRRTRVTTTTTEETV